MASMNQPDAIVSIASDLTAALSSEERYRLSLAQAPSGPGSGASPADVHLASISFPARSMFHGAAPVLTQAIHSLSNAFRTPMLNLRLATLRGSTGLCQPGSTGCCPVS